jgi:hypothetical protein
MAAPDAAWGEPLLRADSTHLAFFDARRCKEVRGMKALSLAGAVTLLAGFAVAGRVPSRLAYLAGVGGFFMLIAGPYGFFRTSFAEHRQFGLYEGGLVPPMRYKGGWDPFVPWGSIRAVKRLAFPLVEASPRGRRTRFVLRFEDGRGRPHRIRETDLAACFGFTEEECVRLEEEILAHTRARLPGLAIEEPLEGSAVPNARARSKSAAQ